jgi:hypothetical protein
LEAQAVYDRRWWTLAVLCLSLIIVFVDGIHVACLAGVVLSLVAAALVMRFLPAPAPAYAGAEDALVGVAPMPVVAD